MRDEADRTLNARDEGVVYGIITCLRHQNPDITNVDLKKNIDDILSEWERLQRNYWMRWFGIIDE
jgi:hypothetical protein